jgi:hypothetical protein
MGGSKMKDSFKTNNLVFNRCEDTEGMVTITDKFMDRISINIDELIQFTDMIKKEQEDEIRASLKRYEPSCKFGYEDCVYDPNYIKYHYPDWYKSLGSPTECKCEDGNGYDDEDK